MRGFQMKKYADKEQFVKDTGPVVKAVFSELDVGNFQDWHCCPCPQLVTCITGSWFVKTSDGTERVFLPGDVLFQDDTKDSPAAKVPQHQSGQRGVVTNQQLIVQLKRSPEVDNPGSY